MAGFNAFTAVALGFSTGSIFFMSHHLWALALVFTEALEAADLTCFMLLQSPTSSDLDNLLPGYSIKIVYEGEEVRWDVIQAIPDTFTVRVACKT
jgi:hypothetical protein